MVAKPNGPKASQTLEIEMQYTTPRAPDTRNLEPYLELGRQARTDAMHEMLTRIWARLRKRSTNKTALRRCLDCRIGAIPTARNTACGITN